MNEHPKETEPLERMLQLAQALRYSFVVIAQEVDVLQKIASTADELEAWLGANMAKEPSRAEEWPGIITCHDEKTSFELAQLLQALCLALKPFREQMRISSTSNEAQKMDTLQKTVNAARAKLKQELDILDGKNSNGGHPCCADGIYMRSLEQKYGMTIPQLRTLVE